MSDKLFKNSPSPQPSNSPAAIVATDLSGTAGQPCTKTAPARAAQEMSTPGHDEQNFKQSANAMLGRLKQLLDAVFWAPDDSNHVTDISADIRAFRLHVDTVHSISAGSGCQSSLTENKNPHQCDSVGLGDARAELSRKRSRNQLGFDEANPDPLHAPSRQLGECLREHDKLGEHLNSGSVLKHSKPITGSRAGAHKSADSDSRSTSQQVAGAGPAPNHTLHASSGYAADGQAALKHSPHFGRPSHAGHSLFASRAHQYGISVRDIVRRLRVLLTSGNLPAVRAAATAAGGHLPLNLLASIAPHLKQQLQALLAATSPGGTPPPRAALSEYVFDGLHLTLLGFTAAVLASGRGDEMVRVPAGCAVVQAPTHRVSSSGDGRSADVRPLVDDMDYDVQPWCESVQLADLCGRWGHLSNILRFAGAGEVAEAEALLLAQEQGRDVDIPEGMFTLYSEFMSRLPVPVGFQLWSPRGPFLLQMVGCSAAYSRLTGTGVDTVRNAAAHDPDEDIKYRFMILHPDNVQHRAVAGLGAVSAGLQAYQVEGQHLRQSEGAGPPGGSAADTADGSGPLVPYFSVSTLHKEKFPSGMVRVSAAYLSDVVPCHQSASDAVKNGRLAEAELRAMQALFAPEGKGGYIPEVQRALRGPVAAGRISQLLKCVDVETAERMHLRLLMVAHAGNDALLQGHASAVACNSASRRVRGLDGVTLDAVLALKKQFWLGAAISSCPRWQQVHLRWQGRQHKT